MTKKGPAIGGAMALIQIVHKRGFPTLVPCKSKFFYKHCVAGKGHRVHWSRDKSRSGQNRCDRLNWRSLHRLRSSQPNWRRPKPQPKSLAGAESCSVWHRPSVQMSPAPRSGASKSVPGKGWRACKVRGFVALHVPRKCLGDYLSASKTLRFKVCSRDKVAKKHKLVT
jgi:hypothetical protein